MSDSALATFPFELKRALRTRATQLYFLLSGCVLLALPGVHPSHHGLDADSTGYLLLPVAMTLSLAQGKPLADVAYLLSRGYSRRQIFWGRTSCHLLLVLLALVLPVTLSARAHLLSSLAVANLPPRAVVALGGERLSFVHPAEAERFAQQQAWVRSYGSSKPYGDRSLFEVRLPYAGEVPLTLILILGLCAAFTWNVTGAWEPRPRWLWLFGPYPLAFLAFGVIVVGGIDGPRADGANAFVWGYRFLPALVVGGGVVLATQLLYARRLIERMDLEAPLPLRPISEGLRM